MAGFPWHCWYGYRLDRSICTARMSTALRSWLPGNVGGLIYPWLWIHFYGVFVGNLASNEVIKSMILILPSIWSGIPKGFKIPNAILASCDLADPLLGFFLGPVHASNARGACKPVQAKSWSFLVIPTRNYSKFGFGTFRWFNNRQNNQLSQNACEGKLQITVHKVVEKLPKLLQVLQAVAVVGPFFWSMAKTIQNIPGEPTRPASSFPQLGQLSPTWPTTWILIQSGSTLSLMFFKVLQHILVKLDCFSTRLWPSEVGFGILASFYFHLLQLTWRMMDQGACWIDSQQGMNVWGLKKRGTHK